MALYIYKHYDNINIYKDYVTIYIDYVTISL